MTMPDESCTMPVIFSAPPGPAKVAAPGKCFMSDSDFNNFIGVGNVFIRPDSGADYYVTGLFPASLLLIESISKSIGLKRIKTVFNLYTCPQSSS